MALIVRPGAIPPGPKLKKIGGGSSGPKNIKNGKSPLGSVQTGKGLGLSARMA